jgi:phosphoribosylformimino-5-aminoimidazole carboxamide ribotide isomerase
VLIPSIDLMGGRVVQLRHGEELVIASDDLEGWVGRFRDFPIVQVIDLDAAMRRGDNAAIVQRLCKTRPCQVGGGVRTPEQARQWLDRGAAAVIIGSALFDENGASISSARAFRDAAGLDRLIAAIDARGGRVVVHGWKKVLEISPVDAALALEPYAAAFLYTHVDREGTMTGLDPAPVMAIRAATSRRLIAAGGIRTMDEVNTLHVAGIDAVVGMAIYTEALVP